MADIWFTDRSRMQGGTAARVSILLGRYATLFQAEVFAILACAHDI
jgi:hypothetical protein